MGTFMGHVIPGTIFLVGGVVWLFSICHRYFSSFSKGRAPYRSRLLIAHFGSERITSLPLEMVIIGVLIGIGLVGETVTGFSENGEFFIGNAQHIGMFSSFLLAMLLATAMFKRILFMPYLDYFAFAMALFAEGILFMYHLHGRDHVDILIHTLLLYVILGCFVSVILEAFLPSFPIFAIMRAFFFTWQGTWFYQVAFMLYSPFVEKSPWIGGDDHRNSMMAVVIFVWHAILILVGQFMVITSMGRIYGMKNKVPVAQVTNGFYTSNINDTLYNRLATNTVNASDTIPMLPMELSDNELNME